MQRGRRQATHSDRCQKESSPHLKGIGEAARARLLGQESRAPAVQRVPKGSPESCARRPTYDNVGSSASVALHDLQPLHGWE
jgi:hypothetical protein